jgi:RNA polymerase-binding transcription factor DksA
MKLQNKDWKQELVDFINAKSKEHQATPRNAYGYFNLMAQMATHQAGHAEIRMRDEPEDKCPKCEVPIVDGGDWGYCTPCFEEETNHHQYPINKKLQEKK